jgi:hypothetical protein
MKVPLKHDLMPSSCVNNEVLKFNRQIEKRVKSYPSTQLFNLDLDRSYYTTHGQHLNSSGKELIANKLAILIKDVLVKKQLNPIQLLWKVSIDETNQNERTSENLVQNTETYKHSPQFDIEKTESTDQKNLMEPTTLLDLPKRQRKQIALKKHTFLMDLDYIQTYKENYTSKSARYIKVYHQNIRGLGMKSGEILGHLHPDYPQVLCLTEHHLIKFQIKHQIIENDNLGTYYCREQYEKGGVAIYIYIHKSIQCTKVSIDAYCKEKDIEICVIKFTYHEFKIYIITL